MRGFSTDTDYKVSLHVCKIIGAILPYLSVSDQKRCVFDFVFELLSHEDTISDLKAGLRLLSTCGAYILGGNTKGRLLPLLRPLRRHRHYQVRETLALLLPNLVEAWRRYPDRPEPGPEPGPGGGSGGGSGRGSGRKCLSRTPSSRVSSAALESTSSQHDPVPVPVPDPGHDANLVSMSGPELPNQPPLQAAGCPSDAQLFTGDGFAGIPAPLLSFVLVAATDPNQKVRLVTSVIMPDLVKYATVEQCGLFLAPLFYRLCLDTDEWVRMQCLIEIGRFFGNYYVGRSTRPAHLIQYFLAVCTSSPGPAAHRHTLVPAALLASSRVSDPVS